jgi:PTH1 family peptidyl-tRNA hydrolase
MTSWQLNSGSCEQEIGGADAGHNGVKSLTQHHGRRFYARLRIGIGNEISEKADASNFVLGKFTKDEQENIDKILREANSLNK